MGLLIPTVQAKETKKFYDPEDEELTHLEMLEMLCTGFPYVGYEKYPEPPQYIQQDYPNVRYGGYTGTIAKNGCGITTLAMLATYMLDEEHDPAELAGYFQHYATPAGTEYKLFDDAASFLGFQFVKRVWDWREVARALEEGHMVISLQMEGPFTSAAHFILLMNFTDDGKIMIKDANIVNHTSRFVRTDYFENGFPVDVVTQSDYFYWIYGKKVVRFPGCDRCADPEVESVPVFLEPHYCSKCTELLNKQRTYHEIMEAIHEKPEI